MLQAFFVESQQLAALIGGEGDIGIVEQGGEIVLGEPVAHALKIDEPCRALVDHDILRLEIPVHEHARTGGERLGRPTQGGKSCQLDEFGLGCLEIIPQAVLKKIPLFPKVEVGIKDALQAQIRAVRQLRRLRVHAQDALESGLVKSAAGCPGSVSEAPKILFTKILHPNQPLLRIVMVNFRNRHSGAI